MPQKCYLKISRNISYKSHTLLSPTGSFLLQQPDGKIQRSADKLLFVDKSSNAAKSEMLGIFISSFYEVTKQVFKDFILFVEISPTASETAMASLVQTLKDQDMDINKFVYLSSCYLIPCLATPKLFNDALKVTHRTQFTRTTVITVWIYSWVPNKLPRFILC